MHFRSQRKLQGEVSLADTLESTGEGGSLSLMDVIAVDDNMLEELDTRDACQKVRRCVDTCLTPRERTIIVRRYGLDDLPPQTQREIATQCGISRSYVSRRAYCKQCPESLENKGLSGHCIILGSSTLNSDTEAPPELRRAVEIAGPGWYNTNQEHGLCSRVR